MKPDSGRRRKCRRRSLTRRPKGFWGKLKLDSATGQVKSYIPLIDHCVDVAQVFRALVKLPTVKTRLESAAGQSISEAQLDRLAVIALLHDIGKANLGFQTRPFDSRFRAGHIRELAPLFFEEDLAKALSTALDVATLQKWFEPPETLEPFLLAAWSHHGLPVRFDPSDRTGNYHLAKTQWWRPDAERDPVLMIGEMLKAAQETFPAAFQESEPPTPGTAPLQHRFAGLLMLADWLGSHESFFPLDRRRGTTPFSAETAAAEALRGVGIDSREAQAYLAERPQSFAERFGFSNPRPLQSTLNELPPSAAAARLLIAEAETGSGKTEAALARFFNLFAARAVDSLYFALPTRVAAKELYDRVCDSVGRVFPDEASRPRVVLAVPGYAQVDQVPIQHLLPSEDVRWSDSLSQDLAERLWAAEHPKRFLAATVAVGTIDQALLSALQTKHAHLRSVCLDRSLLVVDEVHASDPYMRFLLKALLSHHLSLGGHAVLLSATLGCTARAAFLSAASGTTVSVPSLEAATEAPYPTLTFGDGSQKRLPGSEGLEKLFELELIPAIGKPWVLERRLADAMAAGGRVLTVLNTVNRAVAMQRALEVSSVFPKAMLFQCQGITCPHHGRFSPTDREILDKQVTMALGPKSRQGPLLLVGTQTLEQSLDIDADLLVTDLCPIDVLIQRIGRLARHPRERPAEFGPPFKCVVLVPTSDSLDDFLDDQGSVNPLAKSWGLGSVYSDLRVLELTWTLLRGNPAIRLPSDSRRLVEGATHPEVLAALASGKWRLHAQSVEGKQVAQELAAHYAAAVYDKSFGEFSFSELAGRARTRLGLETLRVPLDRPTTSPFSQPLREIVIPGHMAPDLKSENCATLLDSRLGRIRLSYCFSSYLYSRFGLENLDESAD